MTEKKRFASVWDAIEDTPQEAASMRARSALVMSLTEVIRQQNMTQAQAAALFGAVVELEDQPQVAVLLDAAQGLWIVERRQQLETGVGMAHQAGLAWYGKLLPIRRVQTADRLQRQGPGGGHGYSFGSWIFSA